MRRSSVPQDDRRGITPGKVSTRFDFASGCDGHVSLSNKSPAIHGRKGRAGTLLRDRDVDPDVPP